MKECPTFYGLDPQWFKADRLYRIYITHDCLCGAYIAGQIYDEQSAAIQLQSFRFLLSGVLKRTIECRKEREDRYDAMVPAGESFLGEDKRNFRIDRHQVVRITVKRNRSLWTPLNVGTVRIEFGDGSNRRFILVGDQDADVIADSMKRFFAETNIVGKSSSLPKKRLQQRRDWVRFAFMAVFFLGFTVFSVIWAFLRIQHLHFLLIAAFNLWAAVYCLKLVRKSRALPVEDPE